MIYELCSFSYGQWLREKKDGETKEETLLDLSEPAAEAVKNEEVTPATETKPVLDELVPVESKPEAEAEKSAEAVDVVKEEKKEVADTVAATLLQKSEKKSEAPIVEV